MPGVGVAARAELLAVAESVRPRLGTATTLAIVATDATLDKAGCGRLAAMGHDGLARALAPVHTVADGDTVFGLATCVRPVLDVPELMVLQAVAADVVSRAVVHAVLAARTVTTPAGTFRSYLMSSRTRPDPARAQGRQPVQTAHGVHGPAGMCTDLPGCARACRDVHGPAGM